MSDYYKKQTEQFRDIYLQKFGKEISFEEAAEQSEKLLSLVKELLDFLIKSKESTNLIVKL